MAFTLSIVQALEIQDRQLVNFELSFPGITEIVKAATKIPADADYDAQIPVSQINRMIPRGGFIEHIVQDNFGAHHCR